MEKEYRYEHYKMKIETLSPVHIGNGVSIGKKEYIRLLREQKVIIPDFNRMYMDIQKKGRRRQFEEFLLKNDWGDLSYWLKENGFVKQDYERWTKYQLDDNGAFIKANNGGNATPKEIMAFVKDPYGMSYVPGSSIKGMIRTALLAWEIHKNPLKYNDVKAGIARSEPCGNRKFYLSTETNNLEKSTFHTVKRENVKPENAVWSNMAGLIISDSEPIPVEQLTLSQKIDFSLQGKENPLPLLRETLIPGTQVFFSISIDREICPYSLNEILEALDYFQEICYEYFYKRFGRGKKGGGIIWMGGGVGFLSKTIMYPLFGNDAYRMVDKTFMVTVGSKNYNNHHHDKNNRLKLAPHVCKCTRYQGELYDMGMARIEVIEGTVADRE